MKNVIEILERYYKEFNNQKSDWYFFLSLADYVKIILGTPEIYAIIKSFEQEKRRKDAELKQEEDKAINEIETAKKALFERIKKEKISYEGLTNLMKNYGDKYSYQALKENSEAEFLAKCLEEIIESLHYRRQDKTNKVIEEFLKIEKRGESSFFVFPFLRHLKTYKEIRAKYNNQKEVELWGAWDALKSVYFIIFRQDETIKELEGNTDDIWSLTKFNLLIGELNDIKRGLMGSIKHLFRINYENYTSRIHNYLLEELDLQMAKNEDKQPVELFRNNVIPDRSMEMQKQMEESQRWIAERAQKDRQHRELMKQTRMLATKIDKYAHALDLIIERAELTGDGSSFNIDYYDFNFEDRMDASKMLEKFLTELQTNACFEQYGRTNYSGGTKFGFSKVNIGKLKAFKEKREEITTAKTEVAPHTLAQKKVIKNMVDRNEMEDRIVARLENKTAIIPEKPKAKSSRKKEPVRKIIIINMNDGKQLVAVNDNNETKVIRGYAECWKILIKEIRDRNIDQEQRTGVKDISDAVVDYFNTNKRCPIYMNGKYALTDVIIGRDIKIINPTIQTKIITEREYMTLKKRKKKLKKT